MKSKLITFTIFFILTGCTQTTNLLNYTTQEDLNSKGLTPEVINVLERAHTWNMGYPYYNADYKVHQVDNFEILTNPNNPNELYIIKDGNFLLRANDGHVRLYQENTKLPNPSDAVVDWKKGLLIYYNDKQVFYDQNLDGVEMVADKIPYTGDEYYHNYESIYEELPRHSIAQVNIPNKQCYALARDLACCMTEQGGYEPYRHNFFKGWEKHIITSSSFDTELCNPEQAEQIRKTMLDHIKNPSGRK